MARTAPPRKASAANATASASQPATSPTEEQKANTRKGYDRAHSKQYPACYPCYTRQVKCSNTSDMTGFPCTACVRRGTTADCVAHESHPSWVPGVSGATHRRKGAIQKRKRKADQPESEAGDDVEEGSDQEPETKRSKKSAVDDEGVTAAGIEGSETTKFPKRKANALMSEDMDQNIESTAGQAVPMPDSSMPDTGEVARRALINRLMHIGNTNDQNNDQSAGNEPEGGVSPTEEPNENTAHPEKTAEHSKQPTTAHLEPDASKLSTVEEIESSLGAAADRPEVGLVVDQMHNRYASGTRQVPHSMHLLMARIVRSCNDAGVSPPSDSPSH
ncbi:hypothetical protein BST61_g1838 [Cercospora zeina]